LKLIDIFQPQVMPCEVRANPFAAWVAAATVLLFAMFLFVSAPPSSPAITVRFKECVKFTDGYLASFGVTNRAKGRYSVIPVRLEIQKGQAWELCNDGLVGFPVLDTLGSRASGVQPCLVKRLPPGSRLRVVMNTQRELRGMDSFLLRLQLRVTKGDKRWSLNPFNKKVLFLSKAIEIVSDEFVEPDTALHL
jgi:hypothetical protein